MEDMPRADEENKEVQPLLIDVSRLPLNRIELGPDVLKYIIENLDSTEEVLSAFDNYAGDPPPPTAVH